MEPRRRTVARERETLEVDVLFVGAGPGSLAGAIHFQDLVAKRKPGTEHSVVVIEKAPAIGGQSLSGAILDPSALRELIPDFLEQGCPVEGPVTEEGIFFLTRKRAIRFPLTPPPLRNHGNFVCSINKLVRWMGEIAENKGVQLFPGFPGAELMFEGDRVVGVRTRDQGVDKNGQHKPTFEPGVDIRAKVTILGEGPRGSLTKVLVDRLKLDAGKNPQAYGIGLKELWEVPEGRFPCGKIVHTVGFPLPSSIYGGSFVYGMQKNLVAVGLVVGLDYKDPTFDPHRAFQLFKTHPLVSSILDRGKLVGYGAKTVPEGGYFSVPRPYADGVMLIGDSAGLLNAQKLKGIHMAMRSGMIAAEVAFDAVDSGDVTAAALSRYWQRLDAGAVGRELWQCRNFRQAFHGNFWAGFVNAGLQYLTGGRGLVARLRSRADHEAYRKLSDVSRNGSLPPFEPDKVLTFDKVTDVYFAGTEHEIDQPCHLQVADLDVCQNRCAVEYGNPCERFCPAHVYEMIPDEGATRPGAKRLVIHAENCVHCKTCDIADPYAIITWVPPEGGSWPSYANM
ncbi:MAG: electron transfer flavoprotein-ubiquinone oxidoreductase [Planctomycetes bacterium]|nr:electron transfer flavoprotein-ubiquinone oxidoreductase [Planctomycetota bacterium]